MTSTIDLERLVIGFMLHPVYNIRIYIIYVYNPMILTANPTEAAYKLAALLTLVGDDLEGGSEGLVVVGEPLQQRLAFNQLQLHARLGERASTIILKKQVFFFIFHFY